MARTYPHQGLSVDLDEEKALVLLTTFEQASEDGPKTSLDTRTFAAADIHEDVRSWVFLYGLSKVLQDRCSAIPVSDGKMDCMSEVMDMLKEGKKNRERQAGAPVVSAEVEALSVLKGVTIPDIQRALSKYDADVRKKILAHETVVAKAAEIRAARQAETSEASLDDLV